MRDISELVAKAVHDPQAYAVLYESFLDFSKRYAYMHLRNHQDAEDVVQIAWIRVLNALPQFRGDGKFSSWLSTIILNECREMWKRTSRDRTTSFEEEFERGELPKSYVRFDSIEVQHQRRDMHRRLRHQMQLLPRIYRTVLTMYYAQHFSVAEISHRLGISESATKSRLGRARLELAAKLR